MKRLHIHIGVDRLEDAVEFYSKLFGAGPVKRKPDYAKWMLEDPRVNFAVSTRTTRKGVDHLGIQMEHEEELADIRTRLQTGKIPVAQEGETLCCYAKSDKTWVLDPSGIPWEAYRTMEEADIYSGHAIPSGTACCEPALVSVSKSPSRQQDSTGCCN